MQVNACFGGAMDKTRQKIIDATMNLIMEKGYASMTTKDIAQEAHVNESTLFRKFKNKKEIVLTAIEENWHPHLDQKDFLPITKDFQKDLSHFATVYMQKLTPQFVKISIGLRTPELFLETRDTIMKVPQNFKEFLSDYFDMMNCHDSGTLAMMFLSMMFGFVFLKASFENKLTDIQSDEYIQKSIEVFIKGIC